MNTSLLRSIGAAVCLSSAYYWVPATRAVTKAPPVQQPYHLIQKIGLSGTERWDYLTLDSAARHLYVTRGTRVVVLNVDTGKVVGQISQTAGVHGIALAPTLGRGFTSNGTAATVTIFDLKTLQVLGQVKTGENPDAIVYEPVSQRVFTFNGKSNTTTVFDAKSAKVLSTLPLGGRPEFAVADGSGQVYVNIETTNEVVTLEARTLTVKARFPLTPCTEPSGIAIDQAHRRLFIGCSNQKMAVVDADSGQVKATLPIGQRVDANAFDPATGLAFSSNGDGTLTIVHEDSPARFSVLGNVITQPGARTMALDLKTHNVFLAAAQLDPSPLPPLGSGQLPIRPKVRPGTFTLLIFGR